MKILLSEYLQLQQNVAQTTEPITEEDFFDEPHLLLDLDSYVDEQPIDLSIKTVVKQQMRQCGASVITRRRTSVVTKLGNAETLQQSSSKLFNNTFDPPAMNTVPRKTKTSKQQVEEEHDVTAEKSELKPVPIVVNLLNVPKKVTSVIVHFKDHDPKWYIEYYKSYEGSMWHKTPRESEKRYQRWHYHCSLCSRILCAFHTLRYHLNTHMGFKPFRCIKCTQRFPSSGSLYKHRSQKHRKL